MGSEWKSTTLGEVIELKRGYDLPKRLRVQGEVPLISSAGVSDFHSESKVAGPGVVTGRYGTIGEVFFSPQDFWPLNTTLYVRDFKGNDPKFVYYFLKTLNFEEFSDKAAVPGVNRNHVHMAEVTVPTCVSEQEAIAHILGTLDDKIELNRWMNATLEEMAQALFKSWFVDFDPVIDNALAAGNPIPKELAPRADVREKALANGSIQQGSVDHSTLSDPKSLFPAAFEFNDELGWIPEGWPLESIYSLIDVIYGAPFKSSKFTAEGDGTPVIRIRDLKTGRPQNWTEEDHPKKTLITTGDVVVGMDAEFRATIWPGREAYLNQRLFFAQPKVESVNSFYIKEILRPQLEFEENTQVGTTVAHLGKKEIDQFKALNPSREVLALYAQATDPLLSRIINNLKATSNLTKLRDTLLPKLISGDLRLSDPNELVVEIAG